MTKISEVTLPNYTRKEEIYNCATHAVGTIFGLWLIVFAVLKCDTFITMFGTLMFAASIIALYTCSAVYHGLKKDHKFKKNMRLLDHGMIYLLIAGSSIGLMSVYIYEYVPLMFYIITLLEVVLSAVGVASLFIDFEKYKKLRMVLYLVIGWLAVILFFPIYTYCENAWTVLGLCLAGGILYTVGTIFYAKGKKHKYAHTVFHVFVLAGTLMHFIAMYVGLV